MTKVLICPATAGKSVALALKKVVQYSPNWVKNQQRMASTSNQETYRVDIDGRLTIDILRHVRPLQPLRSMRPQGKGCRRDRPVTFSA